MFIKNIFLIFLVALVASTHCAASVIDPDTLEALKTKVQPSLPATPIIASEEVEFDFKELKPVVAPRHNRFTLFDVGVYLWPFLDDASQRTMRLASKFALAIDSYVFECKNKKCGHKPWQEGGLNPCKEQFSYGHYLTRAWWGKATMPQVPTLTPRALYVFDERFRFFLGMYVNIKRGRANITDEVRFMRTYTRIMSAPFFTADAPQLLYANLLYLDLARLGRLGQQEKRWWSQFMWAPLTQAQAYAAYNRCSAKLKALVEQKWFSVNNEAALYCHFRLFVDDDPFLSINLLKSSIPGVDFNGSLMAVMNQDLMVARATYRLDGSARHSKTWEKILALEPAITHWQLELAIRSFVESRNRAKLAECYEKMFQVMQDAQIEPTTAQYQAAGADFYNVGNYERAYFYYDLMLKSLLRASQIPTALQYLRAADACFNVRKYAEAADYRVKGISELKRARQPVTADHYESVAKAYFNVPDYNRALENYTEMLKTMEIAQQAPRSDHYFWVAYTCFRLKKYEKAAEFYVKCIEVAIVEGKNPTVNYYQAAGDSFFNAHDYENASKYYDKMLKVIENFGEKPTSEQYYWTASARYHLKQFAEAADYYVKCLQTLKDEGKKPTSVQVQNTGNAFYNIGDNAQALIYYMAMLNELKAERKKPTAEQYRCLADTYTRLGHKSKAAQYRNMQNQAKKMEFQPT
jgi:tetratricopeptide (TPR) repeat protein